MQQLFHGTACYSESLNYFDGRCSVNLALVDSDICV